MRKKFAYLVIAVASALTLSSCLGDNDDTEYTYYSDTAITAFTLGTVNRYVTEKKTDGNDTTISSTVTGSSYAFVIDQTKGQIYNPDSLPFGCDVEAVLATITSKNSGYVYIKSLTSDSLTYYQSSDSIDFTKPRIVRVLAQDARNYRDYTITVNVHKEKSGEFRWTLNAALPYDLSNATSLKAAAKGDSLFLLACKSGVTSVYLNDGSAWNYCSPDINLVFGEEACQSGLTWNGYLYTATNGTVLRTQNGTNWEVMAQATGIKQLVAASTTELYGLTESGLTVSKDGGKTWSAETLDSDASLLPSTVAGYTCHAIKTNTQTDRVMFVGTRDGDSYATAWTKLVDYSDSPVASQWSLVDATGDTTYALAAMQGLTVIPYNGIALAFGWTGSALSSIYQSVDNGITWKTSSDYTLPDGLTSNGVYATAVDANNYIWMITETGQVWRGRLNDLGW